MRVRQEQVVFALALAVVAALALSGERGPRALRGTPRGAEEPAVASWPAPPLATALPGDERLAGRRELFAPPSDTRPLPPLAVEEPPRAGLALLLPPSDPGPGPRTWGRLLRAELALLEAPELFDRDEPGAGEEDEALEAFAESSERVRTPAATLALHEGWRQRYDWVLRPSGTTAWGRIVNPDRFALALDPARAEEPLRFVEVDPATGRERYASVGAPPIAIAREDVEAFGFADTPANELARERRRIGDVEPAEAQAALRLAERCLELRLAVPDALESAEELYRACGALDPEALEPRRGLARTFAARFDFEAAYATWSALADEHPGDTRAQVALAGIEERFLLERQAEERLRRATAAYAEPWRARLALGRFLLERGRAEEALAELERAAEGVPQDPDALADRVRVRTELASAALAVGRLDEAGRLFAGALSADEENERALAGLRATRLYGGAAEVAPQSGVPSGSGFELSLVAGIEALVEGRAAQSLELLRAARDADPLRADRPLGALSLLAERAGHPEEALRFAQEAREHAPRDPWAAWQEGRLLLARDDPEGAREAFHAALEAEPAFVDALHGLAEAAYRRGEHADAERILERALALEPGSAALSSLRGWNALRRGAVAEARAAFEDASRRAPDAPEARAGLAWCVYLEGDAEEARVRLAELDRARRALPEDEPWRAWARAQVERIAEHAEKVEWTDGFDRRDLRNGWTAREGFGPLVTLVEGEVRIEGVCVEEGRTSVFREYPAESFVSFEVDLWVDPATTMRCGLFVARERQRRDTSDTLGEVTLARHADGALEVGFVRKGLEPETVEAPEPFPVGRWVRLAVARQGEGSDARVSLFLDGVALVEDVPFAALGRAASPLQAGVFVDGVGGRRVVLRLDHAAVVYRR